MRGLSSVFACCALATLAFHPSSVESSGNPPGASKSPALDREVKAARSYLEGWFGAPLILPPIDILEGSEPNPAAALPGHYQNGAVRLRPETVRNESELRRVLRHELTHAVVDQMTRGNCPHWLQEGMAQFLDGTDVVSTETRLRREAQALIPLFRIEGPFQNREAGYRDQAYRQSASAVSFLMARVGRSGLLFLLQRLGEGRPFDRALLETGLSYAELQQAWESSLKVAPVTPRF